jgi:uncharacterized protein (DUF1778 family)
MEKLNKSGKTEQITVRVSAQELDLINKTANVIGGNTSDVVRVALSLLEIEAKKRN